MLQVMLEMLNQLFKLVNAPILNSFGAVVDMFVSIVVSILPHRLMANLTTINQFFEDKISNQDVKSSVINSITNSKLSNPYIANTMCNYDSINSINKTNQTRVGSKLTTNNSSTFMAKFLQVGNIQENTPIPVQPQLVETKINKQFLNEKKLFDIWSKLVIFSNRNNQSTTEPISVPNLITKQHWIYKSPTIYH